MTLDLLSFIILATLVFILLLNNIRLQLKNKKLASKFLQKTLDDAIIIEKLTEQYKYQDIEKTDGFLKFISESRDWAFRYIEEVQEALAKFKNTVEPKLRYASTYGTLAGQSVNLTVIEEITLAYLELKKVMPEEDHQHKNEVEEK
jgi:hypothetical protein